MTGRCPPFQMNKRWSGGCITTVRMMNKHYLLPFRASYPQVLNLVECNKKNTFMMRLHSLITLLAAGLLTASCATGNHAVSFSEARNYFFRNDAKQPTDLLIICSQAELEQYFGEAAFMGKGGDPIKIDFSKCFVVAKVLPVTNHSTNISLRRIERIGDKHLTLVWHIAVNPTPQSYSMQPMKMVVLDKKYDGYRISEQEE